MIDPVQQETHAFIEATCEHYGIVDKTGAHALFIANGWLQPLDFGRGESEPGISRDGLEYVLSVATRNTERLSEFLDWSRKVHAHGNS